jgi:hypothetical protein
VSSEPPVPLDKPAIPATPDKPTKPATPKKGDLAFSNTGYFGGYQTYEEYLESPHWRELSANVRSKPCRDCGATEHLAGHHMSYERLGHELPSDVIPLCSSCHYKFHQHYVYDRKAGVFVPRLFGL